MKSLTLISRGSLAVALTVGAAAIASFVSIGVMIDKHLKAQAALEMINEPKTETLTKAQLATLPVRPNELTALVDAGDVKNQVFIVPQTGFDELLKITKQNDGNFQVRRKQAGSLTWAIDNARWIAIFVFSSFFLAGLFAAFQLFSLFRPLSVLRKSAEDILAGRFEVLSRYSANDDLGRTFAALRKLCVELEEKQVALEKVSDLATKDGLTGLKNHRSFKEELKRLYALAKRHGRTFGIVLLDVDHFKKFNDTYGHQQGDEVLKQVAVALQGAVRVEDFVARYGGEEFILLLPDTAGES
ncbi:MAG: GGDEF domain-containing protein, partial [Bdellovibrionia bacterium]